MSGKAGVEDEEEEGRLVERQREEIREESHDWPGLVLGRMLPRRYCSRMWCYVWYLGMMECMVEQPVQ